MSMRQFKSKALQPHLKNCVRVLTLPDGRTLTWYGNKRTRTIMVTEEKWVGFFHKPLTLENYKDVLTGKEISFTDASWK